MGSNSTVARRPALDASRDSGQITTGFAVFAVIGLLFITMAVILPLGRASDQRTGAQAAADAAALAGAEQLRTQLPVTIVQTAATLMTVADIPRLLNDIGCGLGGGQAQLYATRNDATLTEYCYVPFTDEVNVRVQSLAETQGRRAVAAATARLGPRLAPCVIDPAPVVPPAEEPADDPDEGAPDDAPVGTAVRCGDLHLDFLVTGGRPTLVTTLAQIRAELRPRLSR